MNTGTAASRLALIALCLIGGSLLSSCATVVSLVSNPRMVELNSQPPGALVTLDGEVVGRTPCEFDVPADARGALRLTLSGYEPLEVRLDRHPNAWVLGNLIFPGTAVLVLVDWFAGNAVTWRSKDDKIELRIAGPARAAAADRTQPDA